MLYTLKYNSHSLLCTHALTFPSHTPSHMHMHTPPCRIPQPSLHPPPVPSLTHTHSLREQGAYTPLFRWLHLHLGCPGRPRLHGWLCSQEGPASCAACGAGTRIFNITMILLWCNWAVQSVHGWCACACTESTVLAGPGIWCALKWKHKWCDRQKMAARC